MGTIEKKPAICGVCPGGCGIVATVENGRLIKVEPDKDVPYGNLCIRGRAAPEIVYSPDRLTTPLIRTGKKGGGKFQAATWEDALDLVAQRMKEIRDTYGAQAFVYHSGRGAFEESLHDFSEGFLYPYGSPNMASVGSLCFVSYGILAPIPTFGIGGGRLLPDIEHSKTIVVWGANPITDSPPVMFSRIVAAQKRGARVVAIDHMKSDIARRADQWVAVRSGTDGALALGMMRVIINENIYDKEFVEKWTTGFEDLRRYVQSFTPEAVERITGVSAKTVTSLAREIATTRNVSLRMYTGLEYTNSGVQNIRAVYLLFAVAGHLDVPGGLLIGPPPRIFKRASKPRCPEGAKAIGSVEYPLFHELVGNAQFMEFPKAVLQGIPYKVKGLLNNGSSTLTSYPQPELWEEAYRNLEFMAVIDLFMTAEARYADVILPAATYFEISSYQSYPDYVRLRERIIEPVGEARNSLLILASIAERLGFGREFPQTEEDVIREAFSEVPDLLSAMKNDHGGISLEQQKPAYKKYQSGLLRRDGRVGFDTPSGKVEITSSMMSGHGYDALPVYTDPVEGPLSDPEIHSKYPLVLNTGARIMSTFRSQHQNIPSLVKIQDRPQVLMHSLDAKRRGIGQGDKVIVKTKRGEVCFWADVNDSVSPGSVEVNVGGGKPIHVDFWRGSNANVLTDFYNRDPISGFPVFKALLCEVEKA